MVTPAINLPLVRRGKVRDVYELPGAGGVSGSLSGGARGGQTPERLLIVASDRISAFDVIMPTPVVGKGRLLTEMARFWLEFVAKEKICQTHMISTSVDDLPEGIAPKGGELATYLDGRMMITQRCEVIPIECVVRGYLEGSGWKEYQQSGQVCGITLPKGLKQCDKLPEPIFTPATKEATGHDMNISFERACELVGMETMGMLRELSLKIYAKASAHALARGIIIADTKFEFGLPAGASMRAARVFEPPMLIDEALTPDSSRFWPAATYVPGRAQPSYDKQFLREYLEGLVAAGKWNKQSPGPELPSDVVAGTLGKYQEAMRVLCG